MKQFLKRWCETGLIMPVRLYQVVISPLMPLVCRFHPSCSEYATPSADVVH